MRCGSALTLQGGNAKSTPKKLPFLSLRENSQIWCASIGRRISVVCVSLLVCPPSVKCVLKSPSSGALGAAQGLGDPLLPAPISGGAPLGTIWAVLG